MQRKLHFFINMEKSRDVLNHFIKYNLDIDKNIFKEEIQLKEIINILEKIEYELKQHDKECFKEYEELEDKISELKKDKESLEEDMRTLKKDYSNLEESLYETTSYLEDIKKEFEDYKSKYSIEGITEKNFDDRVTGV